MSDAADLSLVEILDLLARRALSARELVLDCVRRIEVGEDTIQAFVTRTPELALRAAGEADQARARGDSVGRLAGVPVAVKDVFLTRGVRTTAGSRVLAEYVPDEDAAVWQRLSAAGAGLLGKTTTHEFGYGTASPPTRNPWDIQRTPGGSSGGSAAALACRMAPVATGTDTAGSLRIPAAACGISTLRSAKGRVSRYGAIPLSPSFDVAGPLARRMLDVATLMQVLSGYDERDPASCDGRPPAYPETAPADLTGTRIGLPTEMSWQQVDGSITSVCRDALDVLVDHGAELVEIETPPIADVVLPKTVGVFDTINESEALQVHDHLTPYSDLYTPQVRERVGRGRLVSRERYEKAQRLRRVWVAKWRRLMASNGLAAVAHPTLDAPPPLVETSRPPKGPSIRPSVPWTIAGFPALSVPAGFDDRGLPVGLSLAGLPEREADVVGLGVVIDEVVQLWRKEPRIRP